MQNDEQENVSLANLAMGGVVERFDDAFKEALRNIQDPNTTLAAREITLKLKLKPDENRDFGRADITVTSKLAPACPIATKMFIATTKQGAVATEYCPATQEELPGIRGTVAKFPKGGPNL